MCAQVPSCGPPSHEEASVPRPMAVGVQSLPSVSHHRESLSSPLPFAAIQKHRAIKGGDREGPPGAPYVGTISGFEEEEAEAWGGQTFPGGTPRGLCAPCPRALPS